jgi:hypothetical protein
MSHTHKKPGWLSRFVHWLFGAPFQELPPEFGDPVPPELELFEAKAKEAQRDARGKAPIRKPAHRRQTKPIQEDESLERE